VELQRAIPSSGESDAINLIHSVIDSGVTLVDNFWDYNKGETEKCMRKAQKQDGYRNRTFLLTKIDGRTEDSASNK
jgi:predicted aldo/keto reductase-like oxidoreductase